MIFSLARDMRISFSSMPSLSGGELSTLLLFADPLSSMKLVICISKFSMLKSYAYLKPSRIREETSASLGPRLYIALLVVRLMSPWSGAVLYGMTNTCTSSLARWSGRTCLKGNKAAGQCHLPGGGSECTQNSAKSKIIEKIFRFADGVAEFFSINLATGTCTSYVLLCH